MSLLPKEHGAYNQLALPLLTAFIVSDVSTAGLLVAATAVAAFLAHEPAAVLLGQRGPRARRELQRRATRWLTCCLAAAACAGFGVLITIDDSARWSLVIPLVPGVLWGLAMIGAREKSWYGEVAAALAFSGLAVPVSLAAGEPLRVAMTIAIPFALLFVVSTLAVRVVILRVRGGGDPEAAKATRQAALGLAAAGTAALVVATAIGLLPFVLLVAAAPGLLTAALIAIRPPKPASLRPLGWTLVAVSLVTSLLVVVSA